MSIPMKKLQDPQIVLDTSALLYEALSFKAFKKARIYIPFSVLEEIDSFKRDMGEKGRNARQFNRSIELLRQKGSLTKGVQIENSSCLYVCMEPDSMPTGLTADKIDHRILALVLRLQNENPQVQTKLVTKDINLRIKADVLGIKAVDYNPDQRTDFEDLYTGAKHWTVTHQSAEDFKNNKHLKAPKNTDFYPNQYIIIKQEKENSSCLAGRFNSNTGRVEALYQTQEPIWGVNPRNIEQHFALDALMQDSIKLVSLLGKAGTGKTLLALAAGLYKTLNESAFHKLLVSRPVFPMGRDIGYLPGDIEQKLNPWMQPVFDSLEFLMGLSKKASGMAKDLIHQGLVSIQPLAYIRGRSISHQYLIVDEAQNLTPHEIKTILTRAGQETKVILTGDCQQIDNPYVDSSNNGLTFCVEKFKSEPLSAHITLSKGERSLLAERAANLL